MTAFMPACSMLFVAYFPTFLVKKQGFSLSQAMQANFIAMLILVCLIPLFGYLSDKIGKKICLLISIILFTFLAYPIFLLLSKDTIMSVIISEILFVFMLSPICAVILTLVAKLFPIEIRNTASAVGYNISIAIFGGFAPLTAFTLVNITHSNYSPIIFLAICALSSFVSILDLKYSNN